MRGADNLTPEELKDRATRFYSRYGAELEQVAELLRIQLRQLCLAYTIAHCLPAEAVQVATRVKKLASFIKKLENDGWPQFYYPTKVVRDLVGARITCWFIDDCRGLLAFIKRSSHFRIADKTVHPMKDYITNPQPAGYRAIHVYAELQYDGVKRLANKVVVSPAEILCEIQIRSKLQDAWGDITHEFFYKAKNIGVKDERLEQFLADVAGRLAMEDTTLMKFRDTYRKMADDKLRDGQREGFKDDVDGGNLSPSLVKKLRAKIAVTQAGLARLVGVTTQTVVAWEAGTTKPRAEERKKIFGLRSMGKREIRAALETALLKPKFRAASRPRGIKAPHSGKDRGLQPKISK